MSDKKQLKTADEAGIPDADSERTSIPPKSKEIGGPRGPEPTRYGDWERAGRCIDF